MKTRKSARLMIVDEDNRLLLFRYHDEHQAPFWATAGGELVGDESYLDAVKRELHEETGLKLEIGQMLKKRDAVYAVARSEAAKWLERYYLVRSPNNPNLNQAGWTDEEKSTIQSHKWWLLKDMLLQPVQSFKPGWLPELLKQIIQANTN